MKEDMRFAPRSWSFSNSTNASKEDRRMHAKLESLLLARAGFLNKEIKIVDLIIIYCMLVHHR